MTKSLMIDMDDPRAGKIAEVISNKTAKQILSLVAEGEMGVGDIARELNIPINTAMYNVEKLVSAGLIEKSSWIWSMKGKKMDKYKISNKKIIISPKKLAGVIPAMIVSGIVAFGIKMFSGISSNVAGSAGNSLLQTAVDSKMAATVASEAVSGVSGVVGGNVGNAGGYVGTMDSGGIIQSCGNFIANNSWAWFLLGAMVVILVYLIYDSLNERGNR